LTGKEKLIDSKKKREGGGERRVLDSGTLHGRSIVVVRKARKNLPGGGRVGPEKKGRV